MVYGEQWEYKVIKLDSGSKEREKQLNQLGLQGWELVAATEYGAVTGYGRHAYLKRKKG